MMFWAGLLDEPRVTVPKTMLTGSRTMKAGASPVPVSAAVAWSAMLLPGVLPKTVSVPDLAPASLGEKVTWMTQVAEPVSDLPAQASDSVKSPLIATLVTVNRPPPESEI